MVRIVDVREITKPISSPIRNAYIDFTKMTTSLVAVVTDVVRDGKTVVGYGFNSNGRYGQGGLIRERFGQYWGNLSIFSILFLNFLIIVTEFIGISLAMKYFGVSPYLSVPVAVVLLVQVEDL